MADNEKVLNTRIKLKIATYAEWTLDNETTQTNKTNANYVLKRGEIGLCEIPSGNTEVTTAPTVLFKVGDGTNAFKDLKWASALAADVYGWAKQAELPIYDPDKGTKNGISGITFGSWTTDDNKTIYGLIVTRTQFATANELATIDTDTDTRYTFEKIDTETDANYGKLKITAQRYNVKTSSNIGDATVSYVDLVTPEELEDILEGYVESVTTDSTGTITVDNTDTQNPVINFNIADGNNAGNVTLTDTANGLKAEVDLGAYALAADHKDTKTTVSAGTLIDVELTTNNKEFKENSTNNYKVSVNEAALKTLIGQETTAAMEFKGATASLPTSAVKGDMYKISGEFTVEPAKDAQDEGFTAKVGDSIVYDGAKWYLIPSGDDIEDTWRTIKVDNVSIPSTDTLDLVSTEKIELKTSSLNGITHVEIYHKAAPSDSYSTNGIALNHGDSFTVIEETFDSWGHLNGGIATTYTLPVLPTPEDIGAAKPGDIGNGKLAITTESGVLTGSVDFTANQKTDSSITIGVAAKGITTAKIADGAIGMSQTKACNEYTGADKEVWVFDCGGAE